MSWIRKNSLYTGESVRKYSDSDILEACSGVIDEFVKDLRREIIQEESSKEALNDCHHRIVRALREHDREAGILALKEHFSMIDEILLDWKRK